MLLGDIIALNAGKAPDRPALRDGERELTYGQLHENATRLANALLGLAAPGDRVAILAQNVAEYVECYYGVPAAGMALTFLNYRLHPKEWAWILGNAEARVVIVEQSFLDQLRPELAGVPSIEHVVVIGEAADGAIPYGELVATGATTPPPVEVADDDTAWLIYTSGTTGFPKGAMLTHRGLVAAVLESVIEYQPQPDDRNLLAFPLCHVAGYTVPLMHLRGGLVVLMKAYEPELFMQLVERHAITSSALAPTMLNFLLQHPKIDDHDLSTLRNIGYGAAAMPVEVLKAAIDRFGPIVYSGFGMTELGGNVLVHSKEAHIRAINGEEHLLAACGTPMCLADVKVVDETMQECPPGVVGEIVIRGGAGAEGLLAQRGRDEGGVRGRLVPHRRHGPPRRRGVLLHRRPEEGHDRHRRRERVLPRGRRGPLHPPGGVGGGRDRPARPDVGENVTAVVVLRDGMTATDTEIIATCRDRLAGFKKPKRVEFIDELPKNVSGKILKRELRDRFAP